MTSGQAAGQGLPHRRLVGGGRRHGAREGQGQERDTLCEFQRPEACVSLMRPAGGSSSPDQLQLQELLVGLEDGLLGEEFSQNTPGAQAAGKHG